MGPATAVLTIDIQQGLIAGFEADWAGVLERIAALLSRARQAGIPILHVQHDGGPGHPLEAGSNNWQLHPVLQAGQEPVIAKRWSDAFAETALARALEARGIRHLVVVGAQTEFCVDATVRRAASLGYDVMLVADGHTTSASRQLTREQIIAHHNRTLPRLAVVGPRIAAVPAAEITFDQATFSS
jgi:nicotinamidase-related amidase